MAEKRTQARPVAGKRKASATKRTEKAPTSAPRKRGRPTKRGAVPPSAATKKAAQKAAEKAEAAEAIGSRLTPMQRQLRDSAIVARRAAGMTQADVAVEFGVTERQVRRIEESRGKAPSGLDERPMELLEDLLRALRQSISDSEAMAHAYAEKWPPAAIGAKRLAREFYADYLGLMGALGKLPQNLELYRSEAQMIRIAEEMVGKLEDLARGDASAEDVLVFFRALLPDQPRELTA